MRDVIGRVPTSRVIRFSPSLAAAYLIFSIRFHNDREHRIVGQTPFGKVFVRQVQADRLAQVGKRLVQSMPLGYHGHFKAVLAT